LGDTRDRMQVAGDLTVAGFTRRLVAKGQRAERQRGGEFPADAVHRVGIMIAGNPQPIAAALQGGERRAVRRSHAQRPAAIVEAVAQCDHEPWRIAFDQARHSRQCRRCIVGRQQHAACGKRRAFFKMQIGDDQELFVGPIDCSRSIGEKSDVGNSDCFIRSSPRKRGPSHWIPACAGMSGRSAVAHCIASFTSSSAASARSESAASP
jgi:hypothetical protein